MRGCRNERDRSLAPAAGLAALLLLLPALPGAAQTGTPVPLTGPPPAAADAPEGSAPAAAPTAPGSPAEAPGPPAAGSIQATPLAPVDPAWIGTLDDAARPLPQSMWKGTPRALVAAALPHLAAFASPALQDLARRLLLSTAEPPEGTDAPDAPSLPTLRVGRLAALGDVDDALALIDVLPSTQRTEDIDRDGVELHFARNDTEGACAAVRADIGRHQGVWWDRALIACQALAGDQSKASLGLGLLREQQAAPDPAFDALVNALAGHRTKLDKLPEPRPTLVALVAAAKLPLPAESVPAADLPSLRAWAGNEAVPPVQRLAAAERAAMLGALTAGSLAELYGKVEVKPEELGAAIKRGKAPATPRDRAILYQIVRTDPAIGARAAALGALLGDARKRGDFITMARVVAPVIVELQPSQDLASFAPDAVRALYAARRADVARPWLNFIDPNAAPSILLLVRIAEGDGGPPRDEAALSGALQELAKQNAAQAATAVALLYALQDPTSLAQPLILADASAVKAPNVTLMIDLQRAMAGKRLGETVLMSLLVARQDDRLTADTLALEQAVSGLRTVGLGSEARALALEAALAAGL